MKNLLTLTILALMVQLTSCDTEENVSPKSKDIQLLTVVTWSHAEVTHATDGKLSDQYQNFAISFTKSSANDWEGTFIISNGGYAFPENTGKWKLNDDLDRIIFDNGREIQYDVDPQTLKLDFTISLPGGRANGLSGHFVFDLKPL